MCPQSEEFAVDSVQSGLEEVPLPRVLTVKQLQQLQTDRQTEREGSGPHRALHTVHVTIHLQWNLSQCLLQRSPCTQQTPQHITKPSFHLSLIPLLTPFPSSSSHTTHTGQKLWPCPFRHSVCLANGEVVVGYVPRELSCKCSPSSVAECWVLLHDLSWCLSNSQTQIDMSPFLRRTC